MAKTQWAKDVIEEYGPRDFYTEFIIGNGIISRTKHNSKGAIIDVILDLVIENFFYVANYYKLQYSYIHKKEVKTEYYESYAHCRRDLLTKGAT